MRSIDASHKRHREMDKLTPILLFILFGNVTAVQHGRNLIWAMSPKAKVGVARIVGIEGNPGEWMTTGNVTVRHISAPHIGWQFRGLTFNYASKTLYWSESSNKRVQGLKLDGSIVTESIFKGTSKEIDGIAVDWISQNLYLADPKYNWIMMAPLNTSTSVYRLVIKTGLDKPHGIAVHPSKGYLFWSDWGEKSKIEMSDLVGGNRRVLVDQNVGRPRGITIDFDKNILYWVDSEKDTVESIEFNGNSRRILLSHVGTNFYGIGLFQKYLFVTEQTEGHLRIYDKNTGKGYINYELKNIPYGVIMYDEDLQKGNSSNCDALQCQHMCVNDPQTGPRCLCGDGFELTEDQTTCKDSQYFIQPSHIYAIRDAICEYPANLADMSLTNITLDKQCFLKTGKGFLGLAFDGAERTLYYSENATKSISRVMLKKGEYTSTIIRGVGEVKGLAYDWMTGNLFWTDSTYKWIMVAGSDGMYQKTLIKDQLVNPLGIVVHPGRGVIYWTDPARSVIETSAMNGDRRRKLDITAIDTPNYLYLDYTTDLLYWSDSGLHQVMKYNLNSGDVSVVFRQQSSNFYGISIFKDYLIWTDQNDMNGLHVADIETENKIRGILHPHTGQAHAVISYEEHIQPTFDVVCGLNNGGCDHLCLAKNNVSYVCACGTGYQLADDLQSCISAPVSNNFLLVTDSYQRQLYQVSVDDGRVNAISADSEHYRPIAITFDPSTKRVFWTENEVKLIKGITIEGKTDVTLMALEENSILDGIAVDYINRLLYFTDTGVNKIRVISLSRPTLHTTLVSGDLDEPRAIALDPLQGRMYWSDWGSDSKIETAAMDGSDRLVLVNFTDQAWPNGIAIDIIEGVLYWTDARNNRVESIKTDGRDRRTILHEADSHYFGICLMNNYLYITDWSVKYIKRIPKQGGNVEMIGPNKFSRLNGIASYRFDEVLRGRSQCRYSGCDHICIPMPRYKYKCICADGYIMMNNICKNNSSINTDEVPGLRPKDNNPDETGERYIKNQQSSGLPGGGIAAIVVVAFLVTLFAAFSIIYLVKRWRSQFITHDRLVEDNQVDSFYRITFPDRGDSVSFDSGIETQSYTKMTKNSHT